MGEEKLGVYCDIFRLGFEAAVEINSYSMKDPSPKKTATGLLSKRLGAYAEKIKVGGLDSPHDKIFRRVVENYVGGAIQDDSYQFARRIEGIVEGLKTIEELPPIERERMVGLCCDLSDLAENVNFKKKDFPRREVA